MRTAGTIALAEVYNNRVAPVVRTTSPSERPGPLAFMIGRSLALPVLIGLFFAGCTATDRATTSVPVWELANAEPLQPVSVGRGRLSFDRPLPPHLVQELSPEFSLITIRTAKDWQDVQRRLRLPGLPAGVDLSQGSIVGLLASVGESMDGRWPIHLQCLRRCGTEGSLEAAFSFGLYYPVLTAGYIELVYAPGINNISMVSIDKRRFILRSPRPAN